MNIYVILDADDPAVIAVHASVNSVFTEITMSNRPRGLFDAVAWERKQDELNARLEILYVGGNLDLNEIDSSWTGTVLCRPLLEVS